MSPSNPLGKMTTVSRHPPTGPLCRSGLVHAVLYRYVPVMEEDGEQSLGCLHHVVILLSKQQADPTAKVTLFPKLHTVSLQEAPEFL